MKRIRPLHAVPLSLCFLLACSVGSEGTLDEGGPYEELDVERAQLKYATTTDLMRHVVAPGCAAETNECHSNEDFPDLHSEGNLWNLVDLPCNLGVGERNTIEDFCEDLGDQLRITSGANAGFTTTIGSIELVTSEEGEFMHYAVRVDTAPGQAQTDGDFEFVRGGTLVAALGGGQSLQATGGTTTVLITGAEDIPDPVGIRQGDENQNNVFGNATGVIVRSGSARDSYLVRRLLQQETTRERMPLNENADNPTELAADLSPDAMYAIMSWINCMQEGDDVGSPIRYDCAANASNTGAW